LRNTVRNSKFSVLTSQFRLVVFDLDGTLIDSRRDLANAANALLVECGGRPLPEDDIGRMVGDGAATLVARVFAAAQVAAPPDALPRFLAEYARHLLDYTRPYTGIPDVLEALSRRARLALLTNKPLASTREILRGLDLARHFPEALVIGGDGPFPRKPDPAGLRHLIAATGVEADAAILVGDSVIDWRTARHAATSICLARYGFGFEGFPVGELGGADRLVDAPAELLAL
jgi:phosphoglycolate phosphatase